MAGTLTASSAEQIIALCDAGIYEACGGSAPLDLLARGMVERHTGDLEIAKDLLSKAQRRLPAEWQETATVQLSAAYYQAGEKSEALALLEPLSPSFDALLMRAIIETDSDPVIALETLSRAADYDVSRYKWGRLHSQRGICFRRLGNYERAVAEHKAALYFWQDCPLRAFAENNLAAALESPDQSHAQLDRAIQSLQGPCLARAYDEKAKAFLSESDLTKAEEYATWSVDLLSQSDRRAWLVESLLTRAHVFESQQKPRLVVEDLFRACEIAEYLNDEDLELHAAKEIARFTALTTKSYHIRSVVLALKSSRSLTSAAQKLGTSRQALQEFMERNGINDRARRSIIKSC